MTEEMFCPCCGAAVSPEQVTEPRFAACAHCKLSVLVKSRAARASSPLPAKPTAWPAGFVVELVEKPPVAMAAGPYRTAAPPRVRPGLTIRWRTHGRRARW